MSMSARALITTPEETEELQRLHGEYVEATARVAQTMLTHGEPLSEETLNLVIEEDARASNVMQRFKAIYGVRKFRLKTPSR